MIHTSRLTLEDHPARKRDKRTKHLTDEPLFPEQRQIMHDGVRIGYCTTKLDSPISLIVRLAPEDKDTVKQFVEQELAGTRGKVHQPPEPLPVEAEEIDFDEDE